MGRSTQVIGLNNYALDYVKDLHFELYEMTTGMFGEPVAGRTFSKQEENGVLILTEVVQDSPWSSGPMIFTCLRATFQNKAGQVLDFGEYFRWMIDPSLKGEEFDEATGRYYV